MERYHLILDKHKFLTRTTCNKSNKRAIQKLTSWRWWRRWRCLVSLWCFWCDWCPSSKIGKRWKSVGWSSMRPRSSPQAGSGGEEKYYQNYVPRRSFSVSKASRRTKWKRCYSDTHLGFWTLQICGFLWPQERLFKFIKRKWSTVLKGWRNNFGFDLCVTGHAWIGYEIQGSIYHWGSEQTNYYVDSNQTTNDSYGNGGPQYLKGNTIVKLYCSLTS